MKIHIRRITDNGLSLDESFPVEFIGGAQNDVLRFEAPYEIAARAIRAEDEMVVDLSAQSRYVTCCSRCLEEVKRDWDARFTLVYDVKEFNETIELDEDIRQEIILHLPARILCSETCKGLCVDCGVNLNKQTCAHQHAVTGI